MVVHAGSCATPMLVEKLKVPDGSFEGAKKGITGGDWRELRKSCIVVQVDSAVRVLERQKLPGRISIT